MSQNHFLDAKNKRCPMPIVLLSQAIKSLKNGEIIEVHATDAIFKIDVEAWCKKTGNTLLDYLETEEYSVAKIKKVEN